MTNLSNPARLVLATRGSALALWQADHVTARLAAVAPSMIVERLIIKTSGDKILDVPLSKVGGKGLFVKEIEQALLDGTGDVAVHSMKDVPPDLAPGLMLAAISQGEVPWDALCVRDESRRQWSHGGGATLLDRLPNGAIVGTSSMRRQCQLLARRPDLQIRMLRGNVPTRIAKLDAGEFDAIVLAAAGLTRLGLADRISEALPPDVCLPAVAQGVLGLETRIDDHAMIDVIRRAMHDERQSERVVAERSFLLRMGGSCETPLAAHAVHMADGGLRMVGMCGMPDGTRILRDEMQGATANAAALGVALAEKLLAQGAAAILDATK